MILSLYVLSLWGSASGLYVKVLLKPIILNEQNNKAEKYYGKGEDRQKVLIAVNASLGIKIRNLWTCITT